MRPKMARSIVSSHMPRSLISMSPIQSLDDKLFSNDTAGLFAAYGVKTNKPNVKQPSCNVSVQTTEYMPPDIVNLKFYMAASAFLSLNSSLFSFLFFFCFLFFFFTRVDVSISKAEEQDLKYV
jgi:hypothetical protein